MISNLIFKVSYQMCLTAEDRNSRCSFVRGLRLDWDFDEAAGEGGLSIVALLFGLVLKNRFCLDCENAGMRKSWKGNWRLWRTRCVCTLGKDMLVDVLTTKL